MALKAIKPEIIKAAKPKFIISGKSGVGKTFFMLSFPKPFIIDTEGGATRPEYVTKMKESGAGYMGKEQGSQDFSEVIGQLKELSTTKHNYETLIIDSFSKLYNLTAAIAEEKIGSDFGKDRKEANKPTRQLMRWMENLDMTIGLVCHHKDKWERNGGQPTYAGSTFDGWEKMEYDLDLWIEAQLTGKNRSFTVKKSRIRDFIVGNSFPLEYDTFAKLYGKEVIESPAEALSMASETQVKALLSLLEVVKVEQSDLDKYLVKCGAESFADLSQEQITDLTTRLQKKIQGATK